MGDYNELQRLGLENYELREEIKNLKLTLEQMENTCKDYLNDRDTLREENKKLKEDNRFLTKISKEYMKKEHIVEVTEFTELYKDDLEEENKKLKEERDFFKEQAILWRKDYKNEYEENKRLNERIRFLEQCLDNKEKVNISLREELGKFVMNNPS